MQRPGLKFASWLLAFAAGVGSTFIIRLVLRPPSTSLVAQSQSIVLQVAPPTINQPVEESPPDEESEPDTPRIVELKFRTNSMSEKAEDYYQLEASYPQLVDVSTSAARRFNRQLEDLVQGHMAQVKKQGKRMVYDLQRKGKESRYEEGLAISYEILLATPDIISIIFTHTYQWTFHPIISFETFNFDLKSGRRLALRDLFTRRAGHLQALSAASRVKLVEFYEFSEPDSWMKRGTEAKAENFEAWNIVPEGIMLSYREYQVGPYSMSAPSIVIPFSELKSLATGKEPLASVIKINVPR